MTAKAIRSAIYTRKSTEEGLEQDFNSLHAQRAACEAFVLSQAGEGWTASPKAYDDGGYSGGNLERPALQDLLADVDRGLVDVVVVYKVDRLTRSLMDFGKIVERFDARGASFVSVTQAFNTTTSMGRLTLNVLLSFAQFEREVTGERIRDKIAASKAKGLWMGGRTPLGYDAVDKKLTINPAEADLVRSIFERYLELGSIVRLTKELHDRDGRSKAWIAKNGQAMGGDRFSRGAVGYLLSNPVYRGAIRHRKLLHDGCHEPIIDESTWSAVQLKLAENGAAKPELPKRGPNALLKGLLFDDVGVAMTPIHTTRRGRRYHYYVSSPRLHGEDRAVGSLPRIAAPTLEAAVREQVRPLLKAAWLRRESSEDRVRAALCRVTLGEAGLVLSLKSEACRPTEPISAIADAIDVTIPISLKHRQSATLIAPRGHVRAASGMPDRALVRAIAIARGWRRMIEIGTVETVTELARREKLCPRHTGRVLSMAYLAPDLVTAIVEGRQPPALTLQAFTATPLPRDWSAQRLRFESFA